jgi:serine/threonine-protein kinase
VRSDVYSAGLVLWEMLAGRRAFTGPPVVALQSEIMTSSPPPLRPFTANASAELVAVVERATAKAPVDRWPTAAAMREALALTKDGGAS